MTRFDDAPTGGVFAVRVAGRAGWRLEGSSLCKADLAEQLTDRGEVVEEIVVIAPSSGGLPDEVVQTVIAMNFGWSHDGVDDCWRAPDEAVTAFPGTPLPVGGIDVHYTVPTGFAMPIAIAAGDQTTTFWVTNTFDPIPDITPWLEHILDGGYPRLSIDREGDYTEFHVFPSEDGVRLVVSLFDRGDEWRNPIDVSLSRLALIEGFYRPLVSLWESEAMINEGSKRWHFDLAVGASGLTEEDMHPYSVRSAKIDAALEVAGRKEG